MALKWRRGPSFDDRATGKFSGSPPSRGGPSFSDRATGKFSGSPRANDFRTSGAFGRAVRDTATNLGQGIANTGRRVGRGLMHPAMMLAGSIANNRAQHDYLDEVYGDKKGSALWQQADYDAIKNLTDEELAAEMRGEGPTRNVLGNIPSADIGSGTSMGQAMKYFEQAGLTENDMMKFMGVTPSKWAGNEAWLESQAGGEGAEAFKTGMSFIKNAKATANLARTTEAARNQLAEEGLPYRSGIEQEGGPSRSYPVDTGTVFEDFRSGIEQEGGAPYSYDVTEEDITADIGGSPYTLDALNLMPSEMTQPQRGGSFSDFATGKGQPQITRRRVGPRGMGQYETDIMRTYPGDPAALDFTDNFPTGYDKFFGGMQEGDNRNIQSRNLGTRAGPGSFDNFYMNEKGDVINRGSAVWAPDISVEFGDEEEELFGPGSSNPRRPRWQ